MQSYRFPNHEIRIGRLARQVGFTQVSLSHEVRPMIKPVALGDTPVVDAYLPPILRRYINQVAAALGTDQSGGTRLMFMQFNGWPMRACFTGAARFCLGLRPTAGMALSRSTIEMCCWPSCNRRISRTSLVRTAISFWMPMLCAKMHRTGRRDRQQQTGRVIA